MAIIQVLDPVVQKLHSTSGSIRGQVLQSLNTLTTDIATGYGGLVQLGAINAGTAASSGGATKSGIVVTRDGALNTTRADVDSSLIGGVPVAGDRGLVRKRQVGLSLVDLLGLVGVLVDEGLFSDFMVSEGLYRSGVIWTELTFIWESLESEGFLPPCC